MSASDFGVLLPETFGAENVVFNYAILRLYCKYLQIEQDIVDWKMTLQTAITPYTCVPNFGPHGENATFFNPFKINIFFGRSYLRG